MTFEKGISGRSHVTLGTVLTNSRSHSLFPAKGINSADTLFIIVQTFNRHARIPKLQRLAHISRHKPRLAADGQGAYLAEGFAFKGHQFVFHVVCPFCCYSAFLSRGFVVMML